MNMIVVAQQPATCAFGQWLLNEVVAIESTDELFVNVKTRRTKKYFVTRSIWLCGQARGQIREQNGCDARS
jgi:hypothetical protein